MVAYIVEWLSPILPEGWRRMNPFASFGDAKNYLRRSLGRIPIIARYRGERVFMNVYTKRGVWKGGTGTPVARVWKAAEWQKRVGA